MKTYEDLVKFHKLLIDEITEFEIYDEFPKRFYQAFLSGDNTLYQKETTEIRRFDEQWIDALEQFLPSLDYILRNFKTELRQEREVVQIEKAKKTGSESIRHLASHPQYIRDVTTDNVVPKKILSIQSEIELQTYENRFIKSLIDRLLLFVDNRYDVIKNRVDLRMTRHFNMSSDFGITDADVTMNIDVKIAEDIKDAEKSLYNRELLRRVTHMAKLITGFKDFYFYKELINAKPVKPPIMKTQIIIKNVHYNRAYMLWIYLDRYNALAYETDTEEKDLLFDEKYLKNIYQTALLTYSTVVANQKELEYLYQYLDVKNTHKKTPKIIKTHPDVQTDHDPITFEDQTISQYLLDESKKVFEKSLEAHEKTSKTKDIALRRALRDSLEVTNALYTAYFEFDKALEDDFYRRFMRTTPVEALDDVKNKAKIAKIIREVKAVDFRNAIRLEKKLLAELSKREKDVVKEQKKSLDDIAVEQSSEYIKDLETKTQDETKETLEEHMAYVSEQNLLLQQMHKETDDKIKEEIALIKALEEERIEEEKEKARIRFEREQAKLKLRLEREKKRLADKKKREAQKDRARLTSRKAQTKKKSTEKVTKVKQTLTKRNDLKLQKLRDQIDALKEENKG
ncbi:MAG: DUF2357 domain-containing protein [Acholeplasmataceae bacterium]|nr:DUF2357 domain-containing protein [Acholeplasmataceae bacterium]